jgi:hypothetical protein
MNTLGTIRNFALISKLEFHPIINHRFLNNHSFLLPLHLYLQLDYPGTYTTQLQFSQLKLLKKTYTGGTDQGESLIFQQFIHSWVCYELVKVLHVFGLQPKIQSDIAEWLPELHKTFSYLTDKKLPQNKEDAMKVLDILFTKTEHNSYFTKIDFGSRKRILQSDNPTLYLVVLTWLRQLQQCFYEYNDVNPG